ncbi:MAG: tRNA uridine-5-carboxymethylaminomethyl(34) synthesis GTPase MnmE [Notoacmeibacter sp.]|nr:tRNA uridine-5-carboxymethylaminomethyl(34) synthesis GTPase MnmE [Notoacmeibacter sp.]MCC0033515.1 tRNA uridine-5-carboxymethylaminomethyl(34) synthesis GTPase MnmE [Brucellaceae bacterium]
MSGRTDTIFSLSSGALPSGVAVIRLSGIRAFAIAATLCGALPLDRRAELKTIRRRNDEVLDRGLVLTFKGPASFTGEDSVELHCHGGRAVVNAVLHELSTFPGCRPAEAGEFTRRAFLNGKIDLTEAEALADLISVETEMQRKLAIAGADGAARALYDGWRGRLVRIRAMLEADFDFADEEDVPGSVAEIVRPSVQALLNEIEAHTGTAGASEIIREGYRVVLAGVPNAGKSSLLNALARRDVAIVTEEAGTTRDLVEVALDLNGYKVLLTDTAGIRESDSAAERIGVERAHHAVRTANLVLVLVPPDGNLPELEPELDGQRRLLIRTKCDLGGSLAEDELLPISAKTGMGLDGLINNICDGIVADVGGDIPLSAVRVRHVGLLMQCLSVLRSCVEDGVRNEVLAEELRAASVFLGRITGRVDVEDLLDVIFSEFCIGK